MRERLRQHVVTLAGTIGERNLLRYSALEAAARYITDTLAASGFEVVGQPYQVEGRTVRNLEAVLKGHRVPEEVVIVGAHYDSVYGSPGANDNATGVAGMLEIARLLAGRSFARTIRYVAFVNEEPPFFLTRDMGSRQYARRASQHSDLIVAMLSLETIGYYADAEGTQHYPFPFGLFYPARGNFLGFVGNLRSRALVQRLIESFRRHTQFPSEGVAAPAWVPGISWSDHWSFWREGYPAVMITDTAPFRYAEYHTSADRPDIVNYDRLARVVAGLSRVVTDLADRAER